MPSDRAANVVSLSMFAVGLTFARGLVTVEADAERIGHPAEDDRNGTRRAFSGQRSRSSVAEDEVYLEANQVGGKVGEQFVSAVRISKVDSQIVALYVSELA